MDNMIGLAIFVARVLRYDCQMVAELKDKYWTT